MTYASSGHAFKLPFHCGTCGRRFRSHLLLVEHKMYRRDHFYCRRCKLDFPTPAELYQHLDTPFNTVSFGPGGSGVHCLACDRHHETMSDFASHFLERHPHGCKHCHLDFHNSRGLQKHLETEHPDTGNTPPQDAPVDEVKAEHNYDTAPTDVQGVASEPITEGSGEADASTSSVGLPVTPGDEPSGDHPVHALPARPPESVSGTPRPLPRRVFYCDKCSCGFHTLPDLKQHLDHSTSVLEHHSTPDGGVRCFACHTIFASVDGFKQHLQTLDYHHRLRLSKWCIPCLLKFHTHTGLIKHNQSVHALPPQNTDPEEGPSTISTLESPPPIPGSAHDGGEETLRNETSGPTVPEGAANPPRPIDLLFASISLPTPTTVPEVPAGDLEAAEPPPPSSITLPEVPAVDPEAARSPPTPPLPSASPGAMQPAAPADLSAPSLTPAASSSRPRPPLRPYSSSRRNPLFCNRCQMAFSDRREQTEHLQKGMSAIISGGSSEGGLVCAQCRRSICDIHMMKAHLLCHEATCIECLIYFHSPQGLQKHRESLHGSDLVADGGPLNEQVPPQSNATAPAAPTSDSASPVVQPTERASVSTPSHIPPPRDDAQNPTDTVDTSASTSTQSPTPPVLRPENSEASLNTSSASSVVLSPPSPDPVPPGPDAFYCRKCKLSFASHQEQRDHVRNGTSAIKPAENNEGLICVQCNRSFPDIRMLKGHLRRHDWTCIPCLLFFHVPWAHRAHMQSLHVANSSSGDDPSNEQPQFQASITTYPLSGPRPAIPVAEPRPTVRGHQPVPRNPRTVRQISIQDFSDTDEDGPSDIDNSQLGGWQESGQGRQRPDANAYSVRTGGNVLGRNQRSGGRRAPEEQRWWWGEGPQPNSWDGLASGGLREPPSIEVASSSKSGSVNPKAPRVSSVAIPCSVCLEEAAVDLTSTPCGHVGCEVCLRKAVKTKPECPICRKPTRLTDLRPLFL